MCGDFHQNEQSHDFQIEASESYFELLEHDQCLSSKENVHDVKVCAVTDVQTKNSCMKNSKSNYVSSTREVPK